MTIVLIVNPSAYHTFRLDVSKRGAKRLFNQIVILLIDDIERSLAMIMIPHGNLACHDIRQGIDKHRRTGEIFLWIDN